LDGISPARIWQNRQSGINATLPSRHVVDVQPGDDLVAAFHRWAAGERTTEAARDRTRERWLRDQASATASWAGIMVDLAEQATTVVIGMGPLRLTGRIVGVARDFCVVEQAGGRPVLIALDAISAVWPAPSGAGSPGGDRPPGLALSMAGALSALADERSRVLLTLEDGDQLEGELVAVGEDVITLRTQPPSRRSIYVRLASVRSCEIR
jgi:hypothetical protein